MSTNEKQFDLYATVTNRIMELLKQGTVPWRRPWSSAGPPMNAITKRVYQGINLWMLLSLSYENNLFLTWQQLKSLNASVKRGETGHIVVYWQAIEQTKQEDPFEEQNEQTVDQQKPKMQLRYHKVFNVDQCIGIPASVFLSNHEYQRNPLTACQQVIVGMQDLPIIKHGKGEAYYVAATDTINMPKMKSFASNEAYYTTLFHELVHSTGHEKRLSRKSMTDMAEFGGELYSLEELVAELGTCYLGAYAGILEKEIENSAAYIGGWLSKLENDNRFIISASTQAQKACDYILQTRLVNAATNATPAAEVLLKN